VVRTEVCDKDKVLAADSHATESVMGNILWSLQMPYLIKSTKSPSGEVVVDIVDAEVVLVEVDTVSEAVLVLVCELVMDKDDDDVQVELVVDEAEVVVVLVCVQFAKIYPSVCTGRQLI